MQDIKFDPNKMAVIHAVSIALGGSPQAASDAVVELYGVEPVFFENIPTLKQAVDEYLTWKRGGHQADWIKHALTP